MKTIIEPFRIKSVEPIKMNTYEDRVKILRNAYYNLFLVDADDVIIDLLTDSGTGAMSSQQWAGIMLGDESYAGSKSFKFFEKTIKDLMGFKNIIPTHQGRAAERILFSTIAKKGQYIPSNNHFDTTRANILNVEAVPVDLVCLESFDFKTSYPFKGNIDIDKLEKFINDKGIENIPIIMLTVTNNTGGGQAVSMSNIKSTSNLAKKYNIPFYIDACRFAENAYFIKKNEPGFENHSIVNIVKEMFSYSDGCTMSAKKDAIANIGGFLCTNDDSLAKKKKDLLILTEGFPTYGGLSGRDLEAVAYGLLEVTQEDYLEYRIKSTEYLGEKLNELDIPIINPPGGHAIYIDAKNFLNHISIDNFPGQALACELFLEGGIRTSEIGSLMFGGYNSGGDKFYANHELVRLAIPRRTYTQSHIDYVIEVLKKIKSNNHKIKGLKIKYESKTLRHFTAKLERE
ncbi:MAG: tyrosine phenol-lyase [Candidatus Marinimicrobia bacterium]|nr:tyrosine phenol-lyase [Candidatus Neomarinimicrobiota bacterium]